MKLKKYYATKFSVLLVVTLIALSLQLSRAAHRHQAASPRGYGSPGVGTPGVGTPGVGTPGVGTPGRGTPGVGTPGVGTPGRGTPGVGTPGRGTPGVGDPGRGVVAPNYVHALPATYERRTYNRLNYYYADGIYYYEYANDGPTIYVAAPVVNGVPTVPPRPYVYTLPKGYALRSFGSVTYYDYLGYYYYVYYINGRAVYVLATVENGVPTVPAAPY